MGPSSSLVRHHFGIILKEAACGRLFLLSRLYGMSVLGTTRARRMSAQPPLFLDALSEAGLNIIQASMKKGPG
jgi:hypothetical protein